jgi:hypothetical protein
MFVTEKRILRNLKVKLELNNACVTSADKGKTVVVISRSDYSEKISQFINDNKFEKINTDPAVAFQKQANQAIQSSITIKNEQKWKLKSMNPTPPAINGLIKLRKENNPIRPVVNMRTSPSYKLAGFVSKWLSTLIQLPFSFNVKNSPQLIQDLSELKFESQFRMCSFDISNMYTNIPTETLPVIMQGIMNASLVNTDHIKHIISLMKTVLSQNYFQHENVIFMQTEGLAMGAPTSSILSEIFLQFLEHNKICKILAKNKIVAYFRYVDDILIIYDAHKTNIANVLKTFNSLHPKIKFTSELEQDNKINFLDITLHRLPNELFASIYRKPTASGYLIPYGSCHPLQHKMAGIYHLVNRIVEYPIPEVEREKEIRVCQQIANNNGYRHIDIAKLVRDKLKYQNKRVNKPESDTTSVNKRWSSITYIGKEANPTARTLRKFNINVAFKCRNTLGKWLKHKPANVNTDSEKYEACGVYKIKC